VGTKAPVESEQAKHLCPYAHKLNNQYENSKIANNANGVRIISNFMVTMK
jgi:hypothetical protein